MDWWQTTDTIRTTPNAVLKSFTLNSIFRETSQSFRVFKSPHHRSINISSAAALLSLNQSGTKERKVGERIILYKAKEGSEKICRQTELAKEGDVQKQLHCADR